MNEAVTVAIIVGVLGPALTLLGTWAVGKRKTDVEIDVSVAAQWQAWSKSQGERITLLEGRVGQLEKDLAEAREANSRLEAQNVRQAALMTSLIEWALKLRDEVLKLGGHPPAAPPEVQAALTSLDAPF